MVGNLDYDPGLEIVVLLEDHRIFVLNNQGQEMAKYQHPTDILFVDVGKINSSQKKVIVFVDQNNVVNVLDIEASVQKLPTDIKEIRGFTTVSLYDQTLIAVGDDSNTVHLLDKKGKIITPIVMYRRTGIARDDNIPIDKVDRNLVHYFPKKWSNEHNKYDRFSLTHNIKPTYEEVKEFLKTRNITLLSKEYENSRTHIDLKCDTCGHEWPTTYSHIRQGRGGCHKCKIKQRSEKRITDIEEARKKVGFRVM